MTVMLDTHRIEWLRSRITRDDPLPDGLPLLADGWLTGRVVHLGHGTEALAHFLDLLHSSNVYIIRVAEEKRGTVVIKANEWAWSHSLSNTRGNE